MDGSIGTSESDLIIAWLDWPSCKGMDDGLVDCAIPPLLPLWLLAGWYCWR